MLFRAQLFAEVPPDTVPWLVACAAIVTVWAAFRPDMVRDFDGRRLPASISARLAFTVLYVLAYVALAAALLLLPSLLEKINSSSTLLGKVFDGLGKIAPFVSMLFFFSLYSLAPFRDVERNILALMHDTRHLRNDAQALTQHLQDCAFISTPEERRANVRSLEEFDVYVTNTDTRSINLDAVTSWRKTASLLRRVRAWHADDPAILDRSEQEVLEDVERAHGRKTRLAMDIIRMLERVRAGGDLATALTSVTELLARTSHGNRRGVDEMEEKAQAELDTAAPARAAESPVRLTFSELQEYLKKIEGYFQVEYRLLLERVARLAAKSVLHAGDRAAERLDELKAIGFEQLGTIRPLTTSRILWMFLSISIGGYLIYYVLWYQEVLARLRSKPQFSAFTPEQIAMQGRSMLVGIAIFVTTLALAALIGALFGSSSTNARAKETPWTRYVGAGLAASAAFFLMQGVRELVVLSAGLNLAPLTPASAFERSRLTAPWFVLPAMTAIGICWLARHRAWTDRLRFLGASSRAGLERLTDGLAMGVLMIPTFAAAVGLIELLFGHEKLPPIFNSRFDPSIVGIICLVGFFIGALAVREARASAHARVVPPRERRLYVAADDRSEAEVSVREVPAHAPVPMSLRTS